MSTVSVVMPALNEEAHIADAIAEVTRTFAGRFDDYEILVFDDGSRDRTGEIAEEIAARDPRVKVTHHDRPKNLGGVYKAGIAQARFEYLMAVPGDNENPGSAIEPVLGALGKADIVIPYPERSKRSTVRNVVSRGYVKLLNVLFGVNVRYYNGTVIHRTENLRSITIETDSFAYQTEALVKLLRMGKSYVEVPITIERAGPKKDSKAFRPKNVYGVLASTASLAVKVHR